MKTNIEMAREANAMHNIIEEWVTFDYAELERFAELVRADERERATRENAYVLAEREACAKVCESHGPTLANGAMLAEYIRARGNT